jgi:DNA polymerase-3 subunit alpha
MAALMTSRRTAQEDIAECVNQCKVLEIPILPPDINNSDETYKVENDSIRFSINTIKGVGENALKGVIDTRPVVSFNDFISRVNATVCDKTVVSNLIKAGTFDGFETNRYKLLSQYFNTRKAKQDRELAQEYESLMFRFDNKAIAQMEKEVLGFYLTHSLFESYAFKPLDSFGINKYACIGGEVTKVKSFFDKNNNKMAFVTLSTEFGNVDVIVFAKQFNAYQDMLVVGKFVMIEGFKENDTKIKTNKITLVA